jgi:hypothetical protein
MKRVQLLKLKLEVINFVIWKVNKKAIRKAVSTRWQWSNEKDGKFFWQI